MSNRDSKGRFVKGHTLGKEYAPIQSARKTKIQPSELVCVACGITFFRKLNKYKTGKFCTRKCTDSYGARTGLKNPMSQRLKLSEKMKGENNHRWRGGVDKKRRSLYRGIEYTDWRKNVFERDKYTCVGCGIRGVYVEADHIIPIFLDGAIFDIENGQTLCRPCHQIKCNKEMKENWVNQYSSSTNQRNENGQQLVPKKNID